MHNGQLSDCAVNADDALLLGQAKAMKADAALREANRFYADAPQVDIAYYDACATFRLVNHDIELSEPYVEISQAQWDALITIPAAPAATGSPECDVPQAERVGLWHCREIGKPYIRAAVPSEHLAFQSVCEYRPAATGTRQGDTYDESRYAIPPGSPVTELMVGMRVRVRQSGDLATIRVIEMGECKLTYESDGRTGGYLWSAHEPVTA